MDMPSESEEVWRYSGIDAFDIEWFGPVPAAVATTSDRGSDLSIARDIAGTLGPYSALVVTRDGALSAYELSPTAHANGLEISSARADWTGDDVPPGFGELGRGRDAFGELHDAFLMDAVVVNVAPKAVVSDPVLVIHLLDSPGSTERQGAAHAEGDGRREDEGVRHRGAGEVNACFPRVQTRVGTSAEAGLIELFVSPIAQRSTSNGPGALVVPVTELDICEDARLRYANIQILAPDWTQVALQSSRVAQSGSLKSFTAGLGACYARVRTDSDVEGQGAESSLLAAYLGTGTQVHDFRTLQDHRGPRTRSELLFKGAVADRAHSVYSGLIRIARGAHGADAFQTNHNLVLSEGAHADSVPNLDIDENDVRCSHASTVGPIDAEQLYYLESRGVEPSVGERLIVLGFFSELAARAPFEAVGAFVEDAVRTRLAGRKLESGAPGDQGNG